MKFEQDRTKDMVSVTCSCGETGRFCFSGIADGVSFPDQELLAGLQVLKEAGVTWYRKGDVEIRIGPWSPAP